MPTNVISADAGTDKHYKHSGFSSTITDSYTSPGGSPRGVAWDGANEISADDSADKHYKHSGFSSTVTDSYTTPGTYPRGVEWDGTNVMSIGGENSKSYKHSGFSSTITDSHAVPSVAPWGIAWDGANEISGDYTSNKHYLHSGFSATISDSYASPGTDPGGITWDASNVISSDWASDEHYRHAGFSATIYDSYASPGAAPTGIGWDHRYAESATVGSLGTGGAVVETSTGDKYAVFLSTDGYLRVIKDIDTTFALADEDSPSGVHGGGNIGWVHAAIDSADDIHIICACDSEQTRDVAYAIFDETAGTIGTWEEAADYTEQAPVAPGVSISIDSSDKPHILFVDAVKQTGATADNVYYTEKTGASWATPTQIGTRASKSDSYKEPTITLRNSDYIEAFYYFDYNTRSAAYRTYTGSWGSESIYVDDYYYKRLGFGGVISTTGGTVYRYSSDIDGYIFEGAVELAYEALDHVPVSVALSPDDGTTRYVFYIDNSNDVHLISNDGGGWSDEGALNAGTYTYVIAEWAYNNENQSEEISYIFDDGTDVYYDSYPLAAVPPRHPAVYHQNPAIV